MNAAPRPTSQTISLPANWAFHSDAASNGPLPWLEAPKDDASHLTFAVVGDAAGLGRPGVFANALQQISWLKPDFIISVGDMIEGYTEDRAELDRQWNGIEAAARAAGRPFFVIPGNHDMGNPVMVDVWRERFGLDHYAFTYKDALFVVLNTEDPPMEAPKAILAVNKYLVDEMARDTEGTEARLAAMFEGRSTDPILEPLANAIESMDAHRENMGEHQFHFLEQVLAQHPDVSWTFVFFHKPLWQTRTENWLKIEALLSGRQHTAFCGHTHYYAHATHARGDYFNLAMTGGVVHKKGPGSMDHTLLVTCRDGEPAYANIRLDGLLDRHGATGQALLR